MMQCLQERGGGLEERITIRNEAPWCVDSPADIHLSDNVRPKKRKTNFEPINCNNYDAIQYCIHKNELWVCLVSS